MTKKEDIPSIPSGGMISNGSKKTGMILRGGGSSWRLLLLVLVVAPSFSFTPSGVDAFLSTRRHSPYHPVLCQSSSLRTTNYYSPLANDVGLLQTQHHHSLPSSFRRPPGRRRRRRQKSFERCHAVWQSHNDDYSTGPPTSNSSSSTSTTTTTVLLEKLAKDLQNLSHLRPNLPSADFSAPTALISAGSSYTRLWTFGTWQRHGVGPHRRYFKHVQTWRLSTSARKIFPAVGLSSLYSILVSLFVVQWWHFMTTTSTTMMASTSMMTPPLFVLSLAQGSASAMAALGAPLALLLTLRANASLGRIDEARQAWGKLILRGRNLAALLKVYVWPHHPQLAILAARHLVVYGWSLKALVRDESWNSQQEVYQTMLSEVGTNDHDDQSIHKLLLKNQQPQDLPPPILLSLALRHIVAQVAAENLIQPNFFVPHAAMEKALDDLDAVTGICQRLWTSPIPPTYSRHLSRIMVMYLLLLPWAMIANLGPTRHLLPWIVGWTSALVSYVLIGVDEIGNEIENPFPLLPLQQLSANLQNVVGAHFLMDHSSTTDDNDETGETNNTTTTATTTTNEDSTVHPQI